MPIDRCYCYQQTFEDLKAIEDATGADSAETSGDPADATGADSVKRLQAHVTFGENCQLCHPYVRRMLETGETVFHEVIEDDPADDMDSAAS